MEEKEICKECKDGLGCECCNHKHNKDEENDSGGFLREHGLSLLFFVLSAIIAILIEFIDMSFVLTVILAIIAVLLSGYKVFLECFENIFHGKLLDENTLMVIAVVVSFVLKEYFESIAIIVLFGVGEMLEDIATDNSRKKIAGLSKLKVNTVRLVQKDGIITVSPETVEVGSLIEIPKGERVAIDGVLTCGIAELDLKAVTGESKLYNVESGGNVYSGALNLGDSIVIKTTKLYADSTVEKIISLVEGANAKKAKSQKFITKFAKIYTPSVVGVALLIAFLPPLIFGYNLTDWVFKALSFLVISCPCALVISVPLGFFIGIGGLAKFGVLIKGSSVVDDLSNIKTAVFDKTGTLTEGNLTVNDISVYNGFSRESVLSFACALETHSAHPVASAILNCYAGKILDAKDFKEISGKGMSGIVDGKLVLIGNSKILDGVNGVVLKNNTAVYVVIDGQFAGAISLTDKVKENAKSAIYSLSKLGVNNSVILSGDEKETALKVGKEVGVNKTFYQLLPEEKTKKLQELKSTYNGKIMYVGDGINDSPCIAMADVGVSMGALGSEASIEASDMVILNDDLEKIPTTIKQSKRIKRIVKENIIGSISVKLAIMVLAVFIRLPVFVAMIGDVGVMLLAVCNSLRAGKVREK